MRPDLVTCSIIPVAMAGVIGIYGLIAAATTNDKMETATHPAYPEYAHFGAGLTIGGSWVRIMFEILEGEAGKCGVHSDVLGRLRVQGRRGVQGAAGKLLKLIRM